MDIAIVTGAEAPLGLRIVQTLIQQGCRVHGIGNNFSKVTYADPQFKGHAVDLTDLDAVASKIDEILKQEQRLDCLVHAIDVTPGNAFEKLPVGNLEAILKIGLLGPVMMTRLALPNLLRFRGQLINVITANKHGHPGSAANALVEGGLREMNKALFDQGRDAGLRVTNCVLRQNIRLSDGSVSDDALAQSHISLDDVARTIEQLVDPKAANVPEEIVLHPRLSAAAREALPQSPLPVDPYSAVVLPPKEYLPPEQPKIPTENKQQVERTIPYTDEEMEDKIAAAIEDFEAHPERYDQPDPARAKQPQGDGPQQEGQGKNKRRRRRGGRNRNKKPRDGEGQNSEPDQQQHKPDSGQQQQSQKRGMKPDQSKSDKPDNSRSGKPKSGKPRSDKPKSDKPRSDKPKSDKPKSDKPRPDKPRPDKPRAKSETLPHPKANLPKKAAKKKVAAKKVAKKKVATKKAAKKVAKKSARKQAVKKRVEQRI